MVNGNIGIIAIILTRNNKHIMIRYLYYSSHGSGIIPFDDKISRTNFAKALYTVRTHPMERKKMIVAIRQMTDIAQPMYDTICRAASSAGEILVVLP